MALPRRPWNLGLLYDWFAELDRRTVMHLDRPFDLAPDAGVRHTGADLAGIVRDASAWLHAAGLRRDHTLVIVKDNHYDQVMLAAAAARIGALPVVLAPLASAETVRTLVGRAGPDLVVASPTMLARAAAAGVALSAPRVRTVVLGRGEVPRGPDLVTPADLAGSTPPPPDPRGPDEPMIVVHSSGTTGVPKLVVHSARTDGDKMSRLETMRLPVFDSAPEDTTAISIAFSHNRIVSWTAGQFTRAPKELLILSDHGPETAERMLAAHPPTSLEACPNIFQRWEELAARRPELFARVRLFIGTFDAIHPRTVRTFLGASRTRMPVWGQGWGQSEIGPVTIAAFTRRSVRLRTDASSVTGDIGFTLPFLARVKVVDPETGKRVRRGTPGMMMVDTPARCLTYLGEPERHAAKVDGRWWNSGDVGVRGRSGRLRLIDREVDVLTPGTTAPVGGFADLAGLSAIELESVLLDRLPAATEVIVLGVPGRPPVPVLCLRDGPGDGRSTDPGDGSADGPGDGPGDGRRRGRLDPAEWAAATAGLPELDEPIVVPWEDVPRTATWKVRRLELQAAVLGTTETFGTGRWT